MSITDPEAEPAQPQEGQDPEAPSGGSPWESLLTRFPDDARDVAAEVLREQETNANKRFQEHADYRKQWEQYEQTGVNQYDPEAVSWAMQFYEAQQNNPQAVVEWAQQYAQEKGVPFGAPEPQQTADSFDEFAGFQDPQQLQTLIDQATGPLKQELERLQGQFEQQAQSQQQAEAMKFIDGQVAELSEKHGDVNREVLELFAGKYIESDPMHAIPRGYEDMVKFANQVEKSALQAKTSAPAPAEGGGVPDVTPEKYGRIDDPNVVEQARQFLRNNR